jgi:hypothetical protein
MPSITHEAPVELFRRNPMLAVALLHDVPDLRLPDGVSASLASTDLTSVVPAQFLADVVILIRDQVGGTPVLAVVVESQLRGSQEKEFSWPVYVTTGRRLYKCPAVLLVIAPDPAAADACRKVIRTGHPGFDLVPIVIDPGSTPDPDDPGLPQVGPEVTVFAACMGALDMEQDKEQRRVLDAVRGLDTERRRTYQTLILAVVSETARHALEELMATPAYKSDFVDALIEQGTARARAEDLLKVLASRGFQLSRPRRDEVQACLDIDKLARWFDRALTASTAEEVFKP